MKKIQKYAIIFLNTAEYISYSVQYGRLMSSRLLTDLSMLRCDRVSASTSRGETPSFSCSRAVMPEEPGHSNAGSVTDERED